MGREFPQLVEHVRQVLIEAAVALTKQELLERAQLALDEQPAGEDAIATLLRRGLVSITRDYKLVAVGDGRSVSAQAAS